MHLHQLTHLSCVPLVYLGTTFTWVNACCVQVSHFFYWWVAVKALLYNTQCLCYSVSSLFPKSFLYDSSSFWSVFLHDQIHFLSPEATNTRKSDISWKINLQHSFLVSLSRSVTLPLVSTCQECFSWIFIALFLLWTKSFW